MALNCQSSGKCVLVGHPLGPEEQLAADLFEATSLPRSVGGILGWRVCIDLGRTPLRVGVGVMSEHRNLQGHRG